jgi:hypothetical protein
MAKRAAALNKSATKSKLTTKADAGRAFTISLKGIPRVDAETKARMEAAARSPSSKRRDYPKLVPD